MTRREAMKTALKVGAYAAPVILSATIPAAVAAQVSGGTTAINVVASCIPGAGRVRYTINYPSFTLAGTGLAAGTRVRAVSRFTNGDPALNFDIQVADFVIGASGGATTSPFSFIVNSSALSDPAFPTSATVTFTVVSTNAVVRTLTVPVTNSGTVAC